MRLSICPFSVLTFVASAAYVTWQLQKQKKAAVSSSSALPVVCKVVFVVGGPGAGKGTQCQLLTERILSDSGKPVWAHLSAGDLLRAQRKEGGPLGETINNCIASGQLVPSEVTCQLLANGMAATHRETGQTHFLIDGFPRSFANAQAWQDTMHQHEVECLLFLTCPEEVMVGRLLERGQTSGRNDDNLQVIRKRFQTYAKETAPIVDFYQQQGKVRTFAADQAVEDVYRDVAAVFQTIK